TAALGAGWESANVQLGGAEPQTDRGNREEGPWRTAPGPLEHLHRGLEEEPLSLQEKAQSAPWVPAVPQEGNTGDWEMAAALLAAGSQGLVTIKDVSLCFSQEEWRSLDPSQTDFYGEYVMQENCGIVVSLRFPIPKLDMLSQLEGGEEQGVPDPQDLEGRDILKVTYTGDGSEHEGDTPDLEAEPPRMLSSVSEDTGPWNPGQDQSWESMPRGPRGMLLSPPFLQEDSFSSLLCSAEMDSLLKPHTCPQCGKQFVWGSHLARHQQTHTGERPYSCLKCEKSFGRRHHLIRHQKTHLHDKPSRCSECGKNFRCNSHLASHQRVHAESKSYKSQEIGESPVAGKQQPAPPVPKCHVCTECGKSFGRRHHLVRHWLTHTGEKPFHCPRCEKSFGHRGLASSLEGLPLLLSIALTLASSLTPIHACSLALVHSSSLAMVRSCALVLARVCSLALAQACSLVLAHTWFEALDPAADLAFGVALDLAVDLVSLVFAFETLVLVFQTSLAFLAALRLERGLRDLGDMGRVFLEERRLTGSRDRPPFLFGLETFQTLK
ncbi:hypothetical protein A6R68_18092, partial [Neotoma lepida]